MFRTMNGAERDDIAQPQTDSEHLKTRVVEVKGIKQEKSQKNKE